MSSPAHKNCVAPSGKPLPRPRPAFTLIELLVVITIIAILIGMLIPALGQAREMGAQTRELSAARQTMVAFVLHANEHEGRVLYGMPPMDWLTDGTLRVVNQVGEPVDTIESQRYPWRLAPYIDYNFAGLYRDDEMLAEILAKDEDSFEYWISLFPSLGMNTTFVGGDVNMLGFNDEAMQVFGRFYLTRISECVRPTMLLAFASARWYSDGEGAMRKGFFRVEPPYFASQDKEWDDTYDADTTTPGANSGAVALRYLGQAVTAQMDGHAETLYWHELTDMRRWANHATTRDWNITVP